MNTDKVTRFEVIDHSRYTKGSAVGRVLVRYDVRVELDLQNGDRTLKVFLTDPETDPVVVACADTE